MRFWLGCVAFLLGFGGEAFGQAVPQFEAGVCDVPGLTAEMRPRVRCGTVSVARDRAQPDAGVFKLAVVVVASVEQPALPDPVLYISGGPGSPLTRYTAYQMQHPYAVRRDLVLVDQRGMGRSEPALCPELEAGLWAAQVAVGVEPGAATQERRRAAFAACRDRAVAAGVDLRMFGTAVTVEDMEDVRRALGVGQWNIVGESYGTTVGMALLSAHPETVRLAVLDSLYPPDAMMPAWSARAAGAREAFFAACSRDAGCAAVTPDLGAVYRQAMARLRKAPLALEEGSGAGWLTASLFELVVDHLVYYPTAYPGLPQLIAGVAEGNSGPFSLAFAGMMAGAVSGSFAAYAAVECRDRPMYQRATGADDAGDELLLYGICADWTVPGPTTGVPVGVHVPVLVLAGQFDPNLGPGDSRRVAGMMGAGWVEFSGIGHNVRHFSRCAEVMVAGFIHDPAAALDAGCAREAPVVRYLPLER